MTSDGQKKTDFSFDLAVTYSTTKKEFEMFKFFAVTLLIAFVCAQEGPVPDARCNVVHPENHVIFLPHPTDCTLFYKCLGGLRCKEISVLKFFFINLSNFQF